MVTFWKTTFIIIFLLLCISVWKMIKYIGKRISTMGSIESVCAANYKTYNIGRSNGLSYRDALLYCLQSRYKVIKTISDKSFPAILEECDNLICLSTICFIAENPQYSNATDAIIDKAYNYFVKIDSNQVQLFLRHIHK